MPRADDDLIRLTPSAVRRIETARRLGLAAGPARTDRASSKQVWKQLHPHRPHGSRRSHRGIQQSRRPACGPGAEVAYFRGSVLSSLYDALFEAELWWLVNPNDRGRSGCSDPLGASCSAAKFRRLHPELFGLRGLAAHVLGRLSLEDRDQFLARTSAYLRWGDGRAAVVLGTTPLVVATYCDEMDAAFLLRFPDFLAREHALAEGTRLVTTNLHYKGKQMAPDIVPGPGYQGRYTNVRPLVADFLAAERRLVEARRGAIAEREYRRCEELGEHALAERPADPLGPAPGSRDAWDAIRPVMAARRPEPQVRLAQFSTSPPPPSPCAPIRIPCGTAPARRGPAWR